MTYDASPNLGYIPYSQRTTEQKRIHDDLVSAMPPFVLIGADDPTVKRVILTDTWAHPNVVQVLSYAYPGVHQFTGSCFPVGTPVRMGDGTEKPIEDVRRGDEVLTHTGSVRHVLGTEMRMHVGDMITITAKGFPFPLTMTDDHPVAVLVDGKRFNKKRGSGPLQWKRADELTENDYVLLGHFRPAYGTDEIVLDAKELIGDECFDLDALVDRLEGPHEKPEAARDQILKSAIDWHGRVNVRRGRVKNAIKRYVSVNETFGRLLGLYLAEGGINDKRVTFTFNAEEVEYASEVLTSVWELFGVEGVVVKSEKRPNVQYVRFQNAVLAAFFKALIPGNVYTKRIPSCVWRSSKGVQQKVLEGWLDGDGYAGVRPTGELRVTGVSVSDGLARDMMTLALGCGITVSCGQRKARGHSKVSYSVDLSGPMAVARHPSLMLAAAGDKGFPRTANYRKTKYGYAAKIREIERTRTPGTAVYDMEVEEDHSFIAGGLAVHNCVGCGFMNCCTTQIFVEALLKNMPEEIVLPFWPYSYGKSRQVGGLRGRGEGSFGSAMAQAAKEYGIIRWDLTDLPKPTYKDTALEYTSAIEYAWSDGAAISQKWVDEGVKHPIQTTSQLRSADEARTAIKNLYACTFATDKYVKGVRMVGSGENQILQGSLDTYGGHQTCLVGWWDHPEAGEIFLQVNSWPRSVYPKNPVGPPCSYWLSRSVVDWACKNGEIFSYSGVQGYPARTFSWYE